MKIAIADDHALVREGLAAVLTQTENISGVLEAATLDELQEVLASEPDIRLILLDLNMPGMDDVRTLEKLQDAYPMAAIAILSATEVAGVARRFLDAGAAGYIPKSANNDVLLGAIALILSGGVYVPTFALAHGDATPDARKTAKAMNMTERQLEVLVLMMEGLSNKGIARELDLTESTVKTHSSAVLKAFGVDNRMKAVREAIRLGLVK